MMSADAVATPTPAAPTIPTAGPAMLFTSPGSARRLSMTDDARGSTFRLVRTMPAPRSRVFEMHGDPQQFARWWGPRGFSTQRVEIELRVGGCYRIAMRPPDGDVFWLTGEFLAAAPHELLR